MKLTEIVHITSTELPKNMLYEEASYYDISWKFTDSSGDTTRISVNIDGDITMTADHKAGCQMPPPVVEFIWRVSRMIRDLPWG